MNSYYLINLYKINFNVSYNLNFIRMIIIYSNLIIKNILHFNSKTELFAIFLFIIAYVLYFCSLEKCLSGSDICGNKKSWIKRKLIQVIISEKIIAFLFIRIISKKISKYHLIHIILLFIIFTFHSHQYIFEDHGMYNLILFSSLFFMNFFSYYMLRLFRLIIHQSFYLLKIFKFISIFILLLIYKYITPSIFCHGWEKGLNNTSIENQIDIYGCKIEKPKLCPNIIFRYFLDYTKLLNINCTNNRNNREIILKNSKSHYINSNTSKFGFPSTNKCPEGCIDGINDIYLKEYILNNIFDVENNLYNFEKPEIIVDFSKEINGELLLDLNYNETLSKQRKLLEKNNSPYSNNLLMIFIDSVSRVNSLRQLKKTIKFFNKFISYEGGYHPDDIEQKFHSFQFFKYHAFEGLTSSNFPRIFYGNGRESKNLVFLSKYFKLNGYMTNYCGDICKKENVRTFHNFSNSELFDHQMLLCDPNLVNYWKPYKKCLYGKIDISYLFDYSNQFWRKYKDNRKFSLIVLNSGYEGTLESLKYIDDILYNYLNSLFSDNMLKDSSVILLSDHGAMMPSPYFFFDFYQIEMKLPMLYMILNDRKNISYNEQYFHIQKNQQTFITAYDLYNTINHILFGDSYINTKNNSKSPLGKSLFTKIDQKKRKPLNYENMDYTICK